MGRTFSTTPLAILLRLLSQELQQRSRKIIVCIRTSSRYVNKLRLQKRRRRCSVAESCIGTSPCLFRHLLRHGRCRLRKRRWEVGGLGIPPPSSGVCVVNGGKVWSPSLHGRSTSRPLPATPLSCRGLHWTQPPTGVRLPPFGGAKKLCSSLSPLADPRRRSHRCR